MLVIISFECIFKFFNWSRLVALPSSDKMKMFYTEHDFEVDLENFEFNLNFMRKEINISPSTQDRHCGVSSWFGNIVIIQTVCSDAC